MCLSGGKCSVCVTRISTHIREYSLSLARLELELGDAEVENDLVAPKVVRDGEGESVRVQHTSKTAVRVEGIGHQHVVSLALQLVLNTFAGEGVSECLNGKIKGVILLAHDSFAGHHVAHVVSAVRAAGLASKGGNNGEENDGDEGKASDKLHDFLPLKRNRRDAINSQFNIAHIARSPTESTD